MHTYLQETTRTLVEAVARAQLPDIWAALSPGVRHAATAAAQRETGAYVVALMRALQRDILDVVDLRGSMVRIVLEDKTILNDMFLTTGGREFVFIRRSGLYFGFLFGVMQVRGVKPPPHQPSAVPMFHRTHSQQRGTRARPVTTRRVLAARHQSVTVVRAIVAVL